MKDTKTYRSNRFLGFVIVLMGFAIIFSVDIDRLIVFYQDSLSLFLVSYFAIVNPLIFLFGFSFQIRTKDVTSRSFFIFGRHFKISDLSHVLYQPTWRGVTPMTSQTNMRSLHIVRHSGGWLDTISLANGAYREEDLADIAHRLQRMNPRVELDEHTRALIKRHSSGPSSKLRS